MFFVSEFNFVEGFAVLWALPVSGFLSFWVSKFLSFWFLSLTSLRASPFYRFACFWVSRLRRKVLRLYEIIFRASVMNSSSIPNISAMVRPSVGTSSSVVLTSE